LIGIDRLRFVRGKTGFTDPVDQIQAKSNFPGRPRPHETDNTPIIDLIPEKYREFTIQHKGYLINANCKDEPPSSKHLKSPLLNMANMKAGIIEIK